MGIEPYLLSSTLSTGCAAPGEKAVPSDEVVKEMIHDRQSEAELTNYARRFSRSIRQDGVEKINNGITSIDEVLHASSH